MKYPQYSDANYGIAQCSLGFLEIAGPRDLEINDAPPIPTISPTPIINIWTGNTMESPAISRGPTT